MESKMRAIHDDDLQVILEKLGLYSKIKHSKITCAFCKKIITLENIYIIFPDSGQAKICCDEPECIKKLTERMEKTGYVE